MPASMAASVCYFGAEKQLQQQKQRFPPQQVINRDEMSGSDERAPTMQRRRGDWKSVKSQSRQTFLFPVLVDARVLNMLAHTNCFRDGDDNS